MADIVNSVSLWETRAGPHAEVMKVAYLLYPGFTALDVVGAFQVLAAAPGMESVFVAHEVRAGPRQHRALPGAGHPRGGRRARGRPARRPRQRLHRAHPTTSSSNGSGWCIPRHRGRWRSAPDPSTWPRPVSLLGAEAATHWSAADTLPRYGVTYSDHRLVRAGKVLTSAGASAGIDLALALLDLSHGPAVAQTVQLILEYDPQPPYDAGSPAKAPAEIGELVRAYYAERQAAVSRSSAPASRVSPCPRTTKSRTNRTARTTNDRKTSCSQHVRRTVKASSCTRVVRRSPNGWPESAAVHPWRVVVAWGLILLASMVAIATLIGSAFTSDGSITSNPESARAAQVMARELLPG